MAGNTALRKADKNKNDEFYTQLSDIETELKHYRKHFKDKVIFCNCDDPYESNFFKYFAMNFNFLGLKKLIATSYSNSAIVGNEFSHSVTSKKCAYKIEITEVIDVNGDGAVDLSDVDYLLRNNKNTLSLLNNDGDFRSEECVELLKEADIVVTNPPFSLFREYVAQLFQYNKKFVIIGNQNAITYKEIFPLLKDSKMWIGYHFGDMSFTVPEYYEPRATRYWVDKNGQKWRSMGNVCWYTNLDIPKRHEEIEMYKRFSTDEFPAYDNYDAVNIDKVADIPEDYYGVMGVPITFLDKYNPNQFELLGIMNTGEENIGIRLPNTPHGRPIVNGKEKYLRVLIRRKQNGN